MRILFTTLFLLACFLLQAQPSKLKESLRNLSIDEKEQVLSYIRQQSLTLDDLIELLYNKLPAEKQTQTLQHADFLTKTPEDRPRTTIKLDKDTIQFETLSAGTVLIDSFKVTNTGRNPYQIHKARANCDCTVLRYPEYPLMPGESAQIRVEFNSSGKSGKTTPGIILYDNSEPNLRTILYLNGEVVMEKRRGL